MNTFLIAFYVFVSILILIFLFTELWWYKTESESFQLKRYHVLEIMIFPVSCMIFLFILLFFYLSRFIVQLIGRVLTLIGDWLNKPFMNEEESK